MKERQILFSGAMVRALLNGSKTQTRRVVRLSGGREIDYVELERLAAARDPFLLATCPYGVTRDRLWVRETFFAYGRWETRYSAKKQRDEWHFIDMTTVCDRAYQYAADNPDVPLETDRGGALPGWYRRPAIFMPRVASRITLEVTGSRVQRLLDISDADCIAEGLARHYNGWWPYSTMFYEADGVTPANFFRDPRDSYRTLWESINGAGSWSMATWVWVVEFKRITP